MTTEDVHESPVTDARPTPKVAAAGLAGAVTTIVVFVLEAVGVEVPPEVAAAVTAVLSFAAGYLRG